MEKKLECYGKTMEKLWNFFSRDLYEPCLKYNGMDVRVFFGDREKTWTAVFMFVSCTDLENVANILFSQ